MNTLKMIQPTYFIELYLSDCQIDIRCNDVLVFKHTTKKISEMDSVTIGLPLNQFILENGDVHIKAQITPPKRKLQLSEHAFLELRIILRDLAAPDTKEVLLLPLKTPTEYDGVGKSLKGLPYFKLEGKFKAEMLPFNLVGWRQSVDFTEHDTEKLLRDTYRFYNKVHAIVADRNADEFLKLYKEKDNILSQTNYMDAYDNEGSQDNLRDLFKRENYELLPLNIVELMVVKMGEGKLLNLRRRNGLSAIVLHSPRAKSTVQLDFNVHKKTSKSNFNII